MSKPIKYGKENQAPSPLNDSLQLDEAGKKQSQQIVGSFLYYARAVNPTILMTLSEISSQQSAPTENTMKRVNQFLDCENPWLSFVDDHHNKGPKDVGNGFLESLDRLIK